MYDLMKCFEDERKEMLTGISGLDFLNYFLLFSDIYWTLEST